MGDGLLATFALTGRDEAMICGDALKAVAEVQSSFFRVNRDRMTLGQPVMAGVLALHLRDVLYGNIGATDRFDFSVVGPAVKQASRIQALCRPLQQNVLISSTVPKSMDRVALLFPLGLHTLRDVQE